jgi:hypothetical protein
MDSNGVGLSGIAVRLTRSPNIGFITQPDTTDALGRTTAIYVTQPGEFHTVIITATAGDETETANLYISGPSRYVLNLTYSPPVPKLIDHEAPPYYINANLVDTTQRGVSGQPVSFAVLNQVGRIGFEDSSITVPRTNSQGLVQALFYNTETDERDLPLTAEIQAVTSSPEGDTLAASISLPLRQVMNSLILQVNPPVIVGMDSVHVTAFLFDTDGHGIVDDTILFINRGPDGLPDGSIIAKRATNENGIATNAFVPSSGVNEPTETYIIALYREGSIHEATARDTVALMPIREIGYITASLQKTSLEANGIDTSSIFMTVQDSTGGLAPDGTIVYLTHSGNGTLLSPQASTVGGQARTRITAPSTIGGTDTDQIIVRSNFSDTVYVADTVTVTYVPGAIRTLQFIYPESTVTMVAGSGQTSSVIVEGKDAYGNHVLNGTQIRFRNDILTSSLSPEAAPTDDGFARITYLVGSGTGDDNVIGFIPNISNPNDTIRTIHPVVFRIISATATTLVLSAAASNIQVGGSSTQIFATLQDAFGNPLSEGYLVAFEITVSPGGNAEQKPSFDTEPGVYFATAPTNINGQAVVQIFSGTSAGAVAIGACTIPLPPESLYVCDEKSLVTISSGPPAMVRVSPNFTGFGGGDTPERYAIVSAIVWDRYQNPVEYGTAVYFTLIPDSLAEIEGTSYTGGAKPYLADSSDGVAYSLITFPCFSTFHFIRVIASSAGESGEVADTSSDLSLPITDGVLGVYAIPGNLWTDNGLCACPGGPYNCMDTTSITATLVDAGGCPISNGIIVFTALVAGQIIGQDVDTTDANGRAFTRYRIRGCEIPCDLDGCSIETSVRATLAQDQEVFGEVNIMCSRQP